MKSATVELLKSLDAAFGRGDMPTVLAGMSPKIVWNEAEHNPYADRNPYIGPDAVLKGVFTRLNNDWDNYHLDIESIMDTGDRLVTLGRYSARFKANGKPLDAQFVHVWTIKDGKATAFQQYTDTMAFATAMNLKPAHQPA